MRRLLSCYIPLVLLMALISCNDREIVTRYFDNGQLKTVYEIRGGVKDGFAKLYFENGAIKYEGSYINDLREGWHIDYYSNGKISRKILYKVVNGSELASKKIKYNKFGDVVSNFSFESKRIVLQIRNKLPYFVGDTLSIKLKILDARYPYSEATLADFDEYLNLLSPPKGGPIVVQGNEAHEIDMRIRITKPGPDTLTWVVRDYKFDYRTDSTGISTGEESYFAHAINVLEK
jgi:hypothetical protein